MVLVPVGGTLLSGLPGAVEVHGRLGGVDAKSVGVGREHNLPRETRTSGSSRPAPPRGQPKAGYGTLNQAKYGAFLSCP
jgi:hypothetical protein